MTMNKEQMDKFLADSEKWENGELGCSEEFAEVYEEDMEAVASALNRKEANSPP